MELSEFKHTTWETLRGIRISMEMVFRPVMEECGLTAMQAALLIEVLESGGISVGEAAKSMGLAAANGSALCKRMEQSGYLIRSRRREDERVVDLALTEKAKDVLQSAEQAINQRYGKIFQEEPEENIQVMLKGMQLLEDLLNRLHHEGEKG